VESIVINWLVDVVESLEKYLDFSEVAEKVHLMTKREN